MTLSLIDLFSGIGGFSLGLERSGGFKTVKFCEMKPHARGVLAKNFPGIPCHEDVTTYDFREGEADAISAGFPCQDISLAGDGAGLAGERSGLYREVVRAVRMVRPQYAVLENVAALLSRGLDVVLRDLAEVGYDAEWHCIPASAVGAPHRRDRIWIIADPRGEQHESGRTPFSGALAEELSGATADADREWQLQPEGLEQYERRWLGNMGEDVADASCELRDGRGTVSEQGRRLEFADGCAMGHADSEGLQVAWNARGQSQAASGIETGRTADRTGWWAVEPDVGRVANGIPHRVDRLAELGNAVVPKIPEIIGRAIIATRRGTALPSHSGNTP